MKLPIQFTVDHEGFPRACWQGHDPAGTTLAQFLEADLAHHDAYGSRILDEGRRLLAIDHGDFNVSGNVFSVRMQPHETQIAPLHDEVEAPCMVLRTEDLLDTIRRWKEFVDDLDLPGEDRTPAPCPPLPDA